MLVNAKGQGLSIKNLERIITWYDSNTLSAPINIINPDFELCEYFSELKNNCAIFVETPFLYNNEEIDKIKRMRKIYFTIEIVTNKEKIKKQKQNISTILLIAPELIAERQLRFSFKLTLNNISDKQKIKNLLDILKQDKAGLFDLVRLSYGLPNSSLELPNTNGFGKKIKFLMQKVTNINPRLTYNISCALNECMIKYEFLKEIRKNEKFANFTVATMCVHPNLIINQNLSAAFCECFNFQSSPFFVENIFDFPNIFELEKYFTYKMTEYLSKSKPTCDFKHCNKFTCCGLCPGFSYVKKNKENLLAEQREFKSKSINQKQEFSISGYKFHM